VSMKGARGVLINITGGLDLTLFEVDQAANRIREEVDTDANIIFGSIFDPSMEGKMRVSVVATGIEAEKGKRPRAVPISLVINQRQGKAAAPAVKAEPVDPPAKAPLAPETPGASQPEKIADTPPPSSVTASSDSAAARSENIADKSFFQRLAPAKPISPDNGALDDGKAPRQTARPMGGVQAAATAAPSLRADSDLRPTPSTESEPAAEVDAGLVEDETEEPDLALSTDPDLQAGPALELTNEESAGETAPAEHAEGDAAPKPKRRPNGIFAWMTGGGGSAEEHFEKGDRYYHGQGVRKNLALALRSYRKAAELGHAAAQNRLGWMYEKGEGVDADYAEAAIWYRRAAEQGHINAMNDLGYMYRQGWGVPQSYSDALTWFRKAAEKYDSYAEYNLGQMYENGWGTEKDMDEAVRWFRRSAARGHEWAAKRLEELGIAT